MGQNKNFLTSVYNTAIKDISGIKDFSAIFNAIHTYFTNESSLDNFILADNVFEIRTEKGRKKALWAINGSILKFIDQKHKELINSIFQERTPYNDKKFVFLWQLCINNKLVMDITRDIFSKIYFSGRATISQNDIIGYLKDNKLAPKWSEETIYRIATKYLSLMTKLDFVTEGRTKSFNHIRLSSEAQVIFLYFAKLFSPTNDNILTNELLPISFIPSEDIHARLKKFSLKGLFNMNFNGVALNIELTHSFKGICDVLYN